MLGSDPLRIYYLLVMDDEDFENMTPFQGFGRSWLPLQWAMECIVDLPGDVTERSHDPVQIAIQRRTRLRPLMWLPLSIAALESLPSTAFAPCTVLFTGIDTVAERVEKWASHFPDRFLHVSSVAGYGVTPESLDLKILREFCLGKLEDFRDLLNDGQKELVSKSADDWEWPETILEKLEIKGHNVTRPNHMALSRLGFTLKDGVPFIGDSEKDYVDAIIESTLTIAAATREIGFHDVNALGARPPGLILFEPALYRQIYERVRGKSKGQADFGRALRYLQQQKTLYSANRNEFFEFVNESPGAQLALGERAIELRNQTLGVGLFAAQTISPVVRLSPGVNHVFGTLSAYARNVRADRPEARRKASRLFANIQQQLSDAIGPDRLELITKMPGPIKIISDAPIEWLPIGNLPLSFHRDCSRIPVTPGNIMMGQLVPTEPVAFRPEDFRKVLLLSSFRDDDPLKNVMTVAMESSRERWEGVVELVQARASTVDEFVSALNEFDGQIVIFDGHGIANDIEPISKIAIGDEHVDLWSLRNRARCPPVVILSACDTQGLDASSHATVGNGFLALGARTVLGTFLPVSGLNSAMLISRLMHRIAEFIPTVLKHVDRAMTWNEVVSGMLRMSLATEIVMELVAEPGLVAYSDIHLEANVEINSGDELWFDKLIDRIAEFKQIDRSVAEKAVQKVVARSDAIRYVQLGNPETIVLAEDTLTERILTARAKNKAEIKQDAMSGG